MEEFRANEKRNADLELEGERRLTLDDVERETRISRLRNRAGQTSVNNFDLKDNNDAFAMMVMKSAKSQSLWDNQKTVLEIQYMHAQEGEATDEQTGEVVNKTRCSFITADGGVFHTGSGIVSDVVLSILETTLGKKKFDPPLTATFEKVKAGPTCTYLTMSVDLDSLRTLQEANENGKEP